MTNFLPGVEFTGRTKALGVDDQGRLDLNCSPLLLYMVGVLSQYVCLGDCRFGIEDSWKCTRFGDSGLSSGAGVCRFDMCVLLVCIGV